MEYFEQRFAVQTASAKIEQTSPRIAAESPEKEQGLLAAKGVRLGFFLFLGQRYGRCI